MLAKKQKNQQKLLGKMKLGVVLCTQMQKPQRGTFANQNLNNAPFALISYYPFVNPPIIKYMLIFVFSYPCW